MLLSGVVFAGLLARLWYAREGLPYIHDLDEPLTASAAIEMMKTGDLNPHFFSYGNLPIYMSLAVDVLHYFYLVGLPLDQVEHVHRLQDLQVSSASGVRLEVSHPSFYLWNRWLNALMGAATIGLVFEIGRMLRDRWAGLLGAAFLAGLMFHVQRSALVLPDINLSFLTTLSVVCALRFATGGSGWAFLWAVITAALAAATKYNAVLCLSVPALALAHQAFVRADNYRHGYWLVLVLLPPFVFLGAMPYALLDLPGFLGDAGAEIMHYRQRGHGAATIEPGWTHLRHQLGEVRVRLGLGALVLAGAGLLVLLRRRHGWLVLVFPLIFTAFMLSNRVSFHRNFLTLYPYLALGIGLAVAALYRRVRRSVGAARSDSGLRAVWGPVALISIVVVASLWTGVRLSLALVEGHRVAHRSETRSVAVDEAVALLERPEFGGVAIAEELLVHPLDVARLPEDALVVPIPELCGVEQGTIVMVPSDYRVGFDERSSTRERVRDMNELLNQAGRSELVEVFGGYLGSNGFAVDPGVRLLDGFPCHATPDLPLGPLPLAHILRSDDYKRRMGVMQLWHSGTAYTRYYRARPGTYELVINAKGVTRVAAQPLLGVVVQRRDAEGMPQIVTQQHMPIGSERASHAVRFEIDEPQLIRAELAILNPGEGGALTGARSISLRGVHFREAR